MDDRFSEQQPRRRRFAHERLRQVTRGRLARMRAQGAPEWLIKAEERAQRHGCTLRKIIGCGELYYEVPLATNEEIQERDRERRDRWLERQGEIETVRAPDRNAYARAVGLVDDFVDDDA